MRPRTLHLTGRAGAGFWATGRRGRALAVVGALVIALVQGVTAPSVSASEAGLAVFPGDSIQTLVDANPEGTTFLIKAGVHRRQHVVPKNGDSFIGEPGAVLTGEDVTEFAFTGTAVRVTIRNLIVEHYNTPSSESTISCVSPGSWVVEDNEVRYNAHVGLQAGPHWVVRNNYIHHNGQVGMMAAGEDIVIEDNEIAFNNTDHHDPYWEAGGTKFVYTTNMVVRNNYVHNNEGPGLWTDINNIYTLYEYNTVTDNYGPGIFHEVSYDAVIRNNVVERNGFGYTGWIDGAGILVSDSPNVEIYGNTVRFNNDGIAGKQVARTDSATAAYGPWELRNLWVHDNTIVMNVGQTGIVRNTTDPVFSSEWNNRFDYNTYTIGTGAEYYAWDPWYMTTAQWKAFGQDPNGRWTTFTTPPTTTTSRPGAPLALHGTPGNQAVRISWSAPPDGGAVITDYVIQSRRKGSTTWTEFRDGVSTDLHAHVTSLSSGALYEFRVAAQNSVGVGSWSPITEIRTGVPTRPHTVVRAALIREVQLSWQAPASTSGAAITDYVIQYRRKGTAAWVTFADGRSTSRHTHVTGLTDSVAYEFRIAARNARGVGVWSTLA
jgi:parallel beta-helix repeat protein